MPGSGFETNKIFFGHVQVQVSAAIEDTAIEGPQVGGGQSSGGSTNESDGNSMLQISSQLLFAFHPQGSAAAHEQFVKYPLAQWPVVTSAVQS
jgi:hypothetical protein